MQRIVQTPTGKLSWGLKMPLTTLRIGCRRGQETTAVIGEESGVTRPRELRLESILAAGMASGA